MAGIGGGENDIGERNNSKFFQDSRARLPPLLKARLYPQAKHAFIF